MKKLFAAMMVVMILACGCARTPTPKNSQHILNKYFHKYGKKFKTSDFGIHKVTNVNIINTEELHKNMVAVTAVLTLDGGPPYSVRCVLQKKALGWKFLFWEKL